MTSRRALLVGTAATALLAGCGVTLSDIQQKVIAVGKAIASLLPTLTSLLPPAILAQVQPIITLIQNLANGVDTGQGTLQAILNALSDLSMLLAPFFPVAPLVLSVIRAAVAVIQFFLPPAPAPTPAQLKLRAAAVAPMPFDEAWAIVQAAH